MHEELRGFLLFDLVFVVLGTLFFGAGAGLFVGLVAAHSDTAFKEGQQSCAVCEVVKNAK